MIFGQGEKMFRVKTHNSIAEKGLEQLQEASIEVASELDTACLLYTSDAADE